MNIALNKPIQIGSKIIIVRESDNAGLYGVYQIVPGERRDPRVGWIGLIADGVHDPLWSWHVNQDAMPVDPERWGFKYSTPLEAVKVLVAAPPASQDPMADRVMANLKTSLCQRCGSSIVWLTEQESGKSVTADAVPIQVIMEDGNLTHGRTLHAATCPKRF